MREDVERGPVTVAENATSKRARAGDGINESRLNNINSSSFFSTLGRRFRHSLPASWSSSPCIAMTAIEAPWRVKTRPCPFYQQGKCLFAESCNFLHNVQIKVPGGPTVIHASPPSEVDVRRTPEGPAVIVDSPHSYRSPPRSPRMNNLLDALKGVIGEDEDVDDSDESEEERSAPAEDVRPTPQAEPPTEPDPAVPDAPQPTNDAPHDPTTPAQGNVVGLHQDREQSPEYEEDSSHSTNSAPTPDILSP
ncbi:hypothetical protein FB107DRAFT_244515, partial [Schizophyllum commune]